MALRETSRRGLRQCVPCTQHMLWAFFFFLFVCPFDIVSEECVGRFLALYSSGSGVVTQRVPEGLFSCQRVPEGLFS